MNKIFWLVFSLFILPEIYAQDVILKKNNELIDCVITGVDSVSLHFSTAIQNKQTASKLELDEIRAYDWNDSIYLVDDSVKINSQERFAKNINTTKPGSIELKSKDFDLNYTGNFLYLKNDLVLMANQIELKYPFMGSPYFIADGTEIGADLIKFYQSDDGFFSNLMDVTGRYTPYFSKRERKGKINLYSRTTQSSNFMYGLPMAAGGYTYYGGSMQMGLDMSYTKYYYNKGFNDLKKVTYENLKIDLADNAQSLLHLEAYKKAIKSGRILAFSGYSIMGVTMISLVNKMNNDTGTINPQDPEQPPAYVAPHMAFLMSGMVLLLSKKFYIDDIKKPEALKRAIDAYNQ